MKTKIILFLLSLCIINLINANLETHETDKFKATKNLFEALKNSDHNLAFHALSKGAYVNAIDDNQDSPLKIACQKNDTTMVKILLDFNAYIDHTYEFTDYINNNNITPMLQACIHGNYEMIRQLIEVAQYGPAQREFTALLYFLASSSWLIDRYMDGDEADPYKFPGFSDDKALELFKMLLSKVDSIPNGLGIAAIYSDHDMAKEIFLSPLHDPNEITYDWAVNIKGSILQFACGSENIDLVKILIDRGADIHYKNMSEEGEGDIISSALKAGNHKVLEYLLSLGLKINDDHRATFDNNDNIFADCDCLFLEFLIKNYHSLIDSRPLSIEVAHDEDTDRVIKKIDILKKYGFDLLKKGTLSGTFLREINDIAIAKKLKSWDIDINHTENGKHEILHIGHFFNKSNSEKFLLDLLKYYPLEINNADLEQFHYTLSQQYQLMAKRKRANDNQEQLFNLINHDDKITKAEEAIANLKKFIIDYKISLIAFDDKTGNSTLHHAILCDKPHMANFIMRFARGLVDIPNKNGYTPIELMAAKKHILASFIFKLFDK